MAKVELGVDIAERPKPVKKLISLLFALCTLMPAACGTDLFTPAASPVRETGVNGETLLLDDLEAVARDPDLTEDDKRARFREMGVEDEDLIDALLEL